MKTNYLSRIIYTLLVVCVLSSCGLGRSLSYEEQQDKINYHKQLDLLWIDYIHKVDSISNEYYNKKK
jgi:hypothetical protein